MRNSVEIHNVVKLTTDVLQEQQTVYFHEVENTMKSNQKIHGSLSKILNVFRRKKPVMTVPDLGPDIIGEVATKQVDPHEYREDSSNIPKLGSDETEVNPGPVKEAPYGDANEYTEEKSSIPKLGLDEAQAVSGSVKRTSSRGAKTITKFLFEATHETVHKISSKKPAFFELWKKSDFEKTLSLIAIFEERKIKRGNHVVLHFDTGTKEIPDIFFFAFAHHFKIKEKVTNKYKDFKSTGKSILVCSYRSFRGLEHPKITLVIDCDIYYVQHYLLEALPRCTSDLYVVVLQNSAVLTQVTTKWKRCRAVRPFEIKISKDVSQRENFEL